MVINYDDVPTELNIYWEGTNTSTDTIIQHEPAEAPAPASDTSIDETIETSIQKERNSVLSFDFSIFPRRHLIVLDRKSTIHSKKRVDSKKISNTGGSFT